MRVFKKYLDELKQQSADTVTEVRSLPIRKGGWKVMLRNLIRKCTTTVQALRNTETIITSCIVMAAGEGMVKAHDS